MKMEFEQMGDEQKLELAEMDVEDNEKKGRRSSILKPQKPRNPLSTLDFSESNPDDNLSRATRRVSFASSNFIKPFAADPEKNTIWDNTYEEEVSHTDSTKSSCDHGTKNCDFLNVTSIYSASADLNEQNEPNFSPPVIDCINIAPKKAQAINNATNTGESLISFARKLRSRSIEQNATLGTMNLTLINKPVGDFPIIEGTVKENISTISASKESRRISCSSTTLSNNTMEMTACITDKENVNPLISDLSLVTPRRNRLGTTKNVTMYFVDEDIECTNIIKQGEDTHCENVPNFIEFNVIKGNDVNDKNVNATKYESIMELTGVEPDENTKNYTSSKRRSETKDEKEEPDESSLENSSIKEQIDDVDMKSVYSYNSANDVQLPIANERGKCQPHVVEHMINQSKQKTIIFNETDVNMDFTNLKISEPIKETGKFSNQGKTKAEAVSNVNLKGKTDINNQSGSDMELTTTFPVKVHSNIKSNNTQLQNRKKTICFNDSGETMEFTNTYQSQKDITKRTMRFDNSESNMEFTATLVGKINIACNNTISQVDDMEVTTVLSNEPIENKIIKIGKDTTGPACDVELPSISNKLKCDMSLTQNLCTADLGLNKPLTKNDKSADVYCNSDDFKKIGQIATDTDNATTSGSVESSNLYDAKENTYTQSNTKNNNPSSTINHQSLENDISVLSISKGINDIKRHSTDAIDEDAIKKRRIEQTNLEYKISSEANLQTNTGNNIAPSVASALETNLVIAESSENTNFQTSTSSNSNILYSEPMKLKLKTSKFVPIPNLSANMNSDGSLPLDHILTPASSFHMNLSAISSCTEDTQQLIHATFSKPETLKILNKDVERSFNGADKAEFASKLAGNQQNFSKMSIESSQNDDIICDNFMKMKDKTESTKLPLLNPDAAEQLGNDFMKIIDETVKNEKSCFLADITPLALVTEEFDQSGLAKSPNQSNIDVKTIEDDSLKNTSSSNSSAVGNYTLRSQMVLTNISKYLLPYEPVVHQRNKNLAKLNKETKENYRQIKQLCKIKVNIVDLEERYKQDMEKNSSSISEVVASTDEDSGTPATLKLIAPKTIRERICELAKKTEKYWEFVKIEEDYCYFYTLFGTLPFKVHIHPELGIVYSVITYTNLSGIAPRICWYQLKLFQQKLKQENLLSVLGEKFDIFSLLDYVYMSMDDIIKFHTEYTNLVKEYEESHHLRMNSDYSITFEILNVSRTIFWIITVKMPLNNISSISKEDITAVSKVGQKVNEEHIKMIAENSPKGLNFLRNYIESVNEYVNRIGRRLRR